MNSSHLKDHPRGEISLLKLAGQDATDAVTALPSPSPSSTANSASTVLSNSDKLMDQSGKKKYVKQVTGQQMIRSSIWRSRGGFGIWEANPRRDRHQMTGTAGESDFDVKVAEIHSAVVNEVGKTALFVATEKGFMNVVVELLKNSDGEGLRRKNRSRVDVLHVAAREWYHTIVQVLLNHDRTLSKTIGPSNATLIFAAMRP